MVPEHHQAPLALENIIRSYQTTVFFQCSRLLSCRSPKASIATRSSSNYSQNVSRSLPELSRSSRALKIEKTYERGVGCIDSLGLTSSVSCSTSVLGFPSMSASRFPREESKKVIVRMNFCCHGLRTNRIGRETTITSISAVAILRKTSTASKRKLLTGCRLAMPIATSQNHHNNQIYLYE
jgi:hypothetical protein